MKRILMFSLNYYPFFGGAEVAIKEITDRIPREEIEFHLIAYRFDSTLPKKERIGNVIVHRVGWGKKRVTISETFGRLGYLAKILYIPLAAGEAIFLNRKLQFSSAWAMMTYMVFPIVVMQMFGTRLTYLITLQEGDPFEHVFERKRIRLFSPILFYGIRHASHIQAISTFLGNWSRKTGYNGELSIIPNGVNISQFTAFHTVDEITKMKEKIDKKDGDVFLVTTSRLVHKNGVDDVIRALPSLPQNISFLIYGIGPDEEKLRTLAKELGVGSRAKFMGQITHTEMPLMLKACDIFIRPSRSEGMGNSFIEAMAAELPVIATQEGGIADFLFDSKRNPEKPSTGWAVDKDSPEQIAETVKNILAQPCGNARACEADRNFAYIVARECKENRT
jgi:glycosyltransferase involved in cell wall biosynthesis